MKRSTIFIGILIIVLASKISAGQNQKGNFEMEGNNSHVLNLNQQITESTEIYPFQNIEDEIFGMAVKANIKLNSEESLVQIVLVDHNFQEYLIYETYSLLESNNLFSVDNISEETSILEGVSPYSLKLIINNAEVKLNSVSYSTEIESGMDVEKIKKEKKKGRNDEKIIKINNNLRKRGLNWVAGPTAVSELSYAERKALYGQSSFPPGFEYYAGGVISTGDDLKSATSSSSLMVDVWDWRDRHGKNWVSPVTDQKICGSCWAFASTGATEALVNLYFNQQLNLDLSEQDVLSCSGAGSCDGGLPSSALSYIANNGVVDEATFPYTYSDQSCNDKGTNPNELIKIGGRIDFGSSAYPRSEDDLKRMIIDMGPLSGGLYDWSHAMVLVGYQVVKEGDVFYYRDLNLGRNWKIVSAGDPLIGKTVWIFKNSWGSLWGDHGYIYVETSINNFGWTHGLKTPVTSVINNYEVICEDADGDGYYWWGLGPKPATCLGPDEPDGDDSDPNLGPLDEYGNCIPLSNAPLAEFSAAETNIVKGGSVNFVDLSTNTPTSWTWSFEGGTPATSSTQNPVVTYDMPGIYDVTLTVSNSDGTATKTATGYITVEDGSPVAEFSVDNSIITQGGTVSFTDLSTNAPDTFQWVFYGGNPATSSAQNPVVIYELPGIYDVTLTVSNSNGADTKTAAGYITVEDGSPNADFTALNRTVMEGESVSFEDKSTNNPDSWSWVFEGVLPASTQTEVQNPTVTYDTPGVYSVSLTVGNSYGTDTKSVDAYITVEDGTPVADFSADNSVITEGGTVSFTDLSTNNPDTRLWTFEGGTPSSSNQQNPVVAYNSPGVYNVSLVVGNSYGADTIVVDNLVTVQEYVAQYCSASGDASTEWIETVIIGSNTHASAGNGYEDFTSVIFNLEAGKTYDLSLIPGSNSRLKFQNWSVWIDYNGDSDFSDAGEQVFTASKEKSTVNGSIQIPEILGTTRMRLAMSRDGIPAECGSIGYGEVEDYTVQITEPVPQPPVAAFSATQVSAVAGERVQFNDLSANEPTSWYWTFPGGTPESSSDQNPSVVYENPGEYDVTLVVGKDGFPSSKEIKLNYITVNTENINSGYCEPVEINSSLDYIEGISVGNAFSRTSSGGGYELSSTIISLSPGQTYNLKLTPFDESNRNFWRVWIDFNNDGDFDDFDETVVVENNSKGIVNTLLNVPAYAAGNTRIRFSMKNGKSPAACDNGFEGEVEDYIVSFEPQAAQFASSSPIEPEFNSLACNFYPNPALDKLYFSLDVYEPGDLYSIYNTQGELIMENKINSTVTAVDLTGISPGVYLISVLNKGHLFREKIIKE